MKKSLLIAGFVLMFCVIFVAGNAFCRGGGQTTQAHPQKLTYPLASLPTIDPQKFNASPSYGVIKGYSEGLIQFHQGKVSPGVAERWDIAPDNKTMTFYLRRDAKWSDGSPLTANDFVYAFRRLADPKNNCDYRWVLDEIVNGDEIPYGDGSIPVDRLGVSAPNDYTFVINFRVPAPYYLGFLDMPPFHPVKRDMVERHGDQYAMSAATVLGNGPYVIKEYLFEQKVVMVPNPNYWNKSAKKLEEVTIVMIPQPETMFAAFRNNEVDFTRIPVEVAPEFLRNPALLPGADVYTYMSGAVDWYCINIASKTNPILANKDFRLALNYALDREQYVAISSNGLYQPATRFVLPAVSGVRTTYYEEYPISVFKTTAELDRAKQHLNAAMRAVGISDPSQISIAIKVGDSTPKLIAENCQDQWQRALGIKVTIDIVTYRAMLSDRVAGNFDLVYAGWMPDFDDPYTYLGYFTSSNSQNGGKFSNARYDELVTTANNFTDPARRLAMYAEAEKILLEEAGLIPLQVRQVPDAKVSSLKGFNRFYLGAEEDWIYAYFE